MAPVAGCWALQTVTSRRGEALVTTTSDFLCPARRRCAPGARADCSTEELATRSIVGSAVTRLCGLGQRPPFYPLSRWLTRREKRRHPASPPRVRRAGGGMSARVIDIMTWAFAHLDAELFSCYARL